MANSYADVYRYLNGVLDGEHPPAKNIPFWSLLAVVMDRRMADVHEERESETIDTVELTEAQRTSQGLLLQLRASTFVGRWYPVRLQLRPADESTLWFGAPDLSVDRNQTDRLSWPNADDEWPAIYRFDLLALAAEAGA